MSSFIFDDFLENNNSKKIKSLIIDNTFQDNDLKNYNLAEISYHKLYSFKSSKKITLKYSGRFKLYGANVSYRSNLVSFKLSKSWESVSEDIVIGLIQSLWNKVEKTNISSMEQNLYNTYVKKLSDFSSVSVKDEILFESFSRVNNNYFNDMMDCPNLFWGKYSKRVLGFYDYMSNRIVISSVLKLCDIEILDFVMYHELLHKKLSFNVSKTGRRYYHTREFRLLESKYVVKNINDRINLFLKSI